MPLLGTVGLYGVSVALAYAFFVGGRYLAGTAFGVVDRVPPFGEAPPSGFERARPGARLAITLAGPLGVYLLAALLTTAGLLLGAAHGPGTTIVAVVPGRSADLAGLRPGDRIREIAGRPVTAPSDARDILQAGAQPVVDVVIERDGQTRHVQVALDQQRKLAVQFGPNHDPISVGRALREGVAYPGQVLAGAVTAVTGHTRIAFVGPIGISRAVAGEPGQGQRLVSVGVVQTYTAIFFLLGSIALWPPRASRRSEPVAPEAALASPDSGNAGGRPVVRALARFIDWSVLSLLLAPVARPANLLLPLLWFPVEALLLCTWGFTPGKWLLGIAVRDQSGHRPKFRSGFRRVAVLWAYGIGADTPFGVATAMLAYSGLKRTRTTYWDMLGGFTVHHRRIGAARVVGAVVVLVAVIAAAGFLASDR